MTMRQAFNGFASLEHLSRTIGKIFCHELKLDINIIKQIFPKDVSVENKSDNVTLSCACSLTRKRSCEDPKYTPMAQICHMNTIL